MDFLQLCLLGALILLVLLMPWLMVVAVKDLFRHKGSTGSGGGGIIGAMAEMDRIVNPEGQHVQEAKEVEREEAGIGGE